MNRFRKYSAKNAPKAWLFLLPALIIVGVFNIYPLFKAFTMSFQAGSLNNPRFNGLNNYLFVLKDPIFHTALKNTAVYAFMVVPLALIISMGIALLIFDKVKFKGFFETVFFIPYLTSTIAIGIVFRYLFHKDYGFVNFIFGLFGASPINFLDQMSMSLPTLVIFGIWSGLAFNIIIILSGLRNINTEYYKVADMFGASKREQFFKITLPQLIPTLTFLLTVNLISAFKVYSQVFALFNGRPGIANSAQTAVFYIFTKFHVDQKYGTAMAATILLFVFILIITVIQNKLIKKVEDR